MLAFLAAAAWLSYRSILRISSDSWIALTATMAAFSSYYILSYPTHVWHEYMMELFTVMLPRDGYIHPRRAVPAIIDQDMPRASDRLACLRLSRALYPAGFSR